MTTDHLSLRPRFDLEVAAYCLALGLGVAFVIFVGVTL